MPGFVIETGYAIIGTGFAEQVDRISRIARNAGIIGIPPIVIDEYGLCPDFGPIMVSATQRDREITAIYGPDGHPIENTKDPITLVTAKRIGELGIKDIPEKLANYEENCLVTQDCLKRTTARLITIAE